MLMLKEVTAVVAGPSFQMDANLLAGERRLWSCL